MYDLATRNATVLDGLAGDCARQDLAPGRVLDRFLPVRSAAPVSAAK
jgi:hypothetical protein